MSATFIVDQMPQLVQEVIHSGEDLSEWVLEIFEVLVSPKGWAASGYNRMSNFTLGEAMIKACYLEKNVGASYRIRNLRTGDILPAAIL